jgi:hypothetical protein
MKKSICSSLTRLAVPTTAIALALFAAGAARADFIVTLTQEGSNVVAAGSGEIDLTGLRLIYTHLETASLQPIAAITGVGPLSALDDEFVGTFSGPATFGPGLGFTAPNTGSGDLVIMNNFILGPGLFVPHGYISNSPLSGSSTWDSATFSSLGVTPGTYEWTWGSGVNQNFVLDAVPEPSLLKPLAVILFGWLGLTIARRRKAQV